VNNGKNPIKFRPVLSRRVTFAVSFNQNQIPAMRSLVTYWTQTGNTQKVANSIFASLPGTKVLLPIHEVEDTSGFDLIFIGFPIVRFGPPEIVSEFLSSRAAGKKIALFITHAMPSRSDDPGQISMLRKELEKCREACAGSHLAGMFHCQGELSEKETETLVASKIPMLMAFAAMRPQTIGHPDEAELREAGMFAEVMATL